MASRWCGPPYVKGFLPAPTTVQTPVCVCLYSQRGASLFCSLHRISVSDIVHEINRLFSGHNDLILGFNTFLPQVGVVDDRGVVLST
jgi:hypothetical protein